MYKFFVELKRELKEIFQEIQDNKSQTWIFQNKNLTVYQAL